MYRKIILSMCFLWSSCSFGANNGNFSTQSVYVYRPSTFSMWGRTVVISVNGLASAELGSCSYAKLMLPTGEHRVEVALKPWPFDRSAERISIPLKVTSESQIYVGFYPNSLSATELNKTFILYSALSEQRYPRYLGIAKPEVARLEMVSCNAVDAITN